MLSAMGRPLQREAPGFGGRQLIERVSDSSVEVCSGTTCNCTASIRVGASVPSMAPRRSAIFRRKCPGAPAQILMIAWVLTPVVLALTLGMWVQGERNVRGQS